MAASVPTTRHLRPPKPRPFISESSDPAQWKQADDALQTHVSPVRVLPQFAQSPRSDPGEALRLQVALRHLVIGKESKGKGRAQPGWTVPRWSNVAELKERLDKFYGPGDINRGLGKGPRNVSFALPLAGTARTKDRRGPWPDGMGLRTNTCIWRSPHRRRGRVQRRKRLPLCPMWSPLTRPMHRRHQAPRRRRTRMTRTRCSRGCGEGGLRIRALAREY